jgi:hypothetical protein
MQDRFWKSVADDEDKRRRERDGIKPDEYEPGDGYEPDPYRHRVVIFACLALAVGLIIFSLPIADALGL